MLSDSQARDSLLLGADYLLRGAAAGLFALIGSLLLRQHRRLVAARLGAWFAFGSAAYAICAAPGLHAALGIAAAPVMAASAANGFVFWLFARALFDDGFALRRWHLLAWAGIAWAAFLEAGLLIPGGLPLAGPLHRLLAGQSLCFALMAVAEGAASFPADLVEKRRRLRVFVIAAAGLSSIGSSLPQIFGSFGATGFLSLGQSALLLAIAVPIAWSLLGLGGDDSVLMAAGMRLLPAVQQPSVQLPSDPVSLQQMAAIERAMLHDRLYRREGLSIGQLGRLLQLPEHRLRVLINQGLGYRNFSSFVNSYRLAEVKAALADPAQTSVPILTIALDSGFNSLGPFNRAFKAETGQTPSEYRFSALRNAGVVLADFKSGKDLGDTSGKISGSA